MALMTLIKEPTPENILLAARSLKIGALIGLPTETVYGLAADAENENAVRRIYEVKSRPFDHPLIVHIGSIEFFEKWAINIPKYAFLLAEKFWPGPLTLILKRSRIAKNFVTGGQESVAIRYPRNKVALSVLQNFHHLGGQGLAAPSANKFGAVSPTDANAVEEEIGHKFEVGIDFILNGGQSEVGVESTIVDCFSTSNPRILRSGYVTKKDIEARIGYQVIQNLGIENIRFPGGLESHYSPNAKVVIEGTPKIGDGFIALATIETPKGCVRLSSPVNLREFARDLYLALRNGDKLNLKRIYVSVPEGDGIAIAIRERMTKAAR
jgi:L-threonylcarbamoyladenylate synthase